MAAGCTCSAVSKDESICSRSVLCKLWGVMSVASLSGSLFVSKHALSWQLPCSCGLSQTHPAVCCSQSVEQLPCIRSLLTIYGCQSSYAPAQAQLLHRATRIVQQQAGKATST